MADGQATGVDPFDELAETLAAPTATSAVDAVDPFDVLSSELSTAAPADDRPDEAVPAGADPFDDLLWGALEPDLMPFQRELRSLGQDAFRGVPPEKLPRVIEMWDEYAALASTPGRTPEEMAEDNERLVELMEFAGLHDEVRKASKESGYIMTGVSALGEAFDKLVDRPTRAWMRTLWDTRRTALENDEPMGLGAADRERLSGMLLQNYEDKAPGGQVLRDMVAYVQSFGTTAEALKDMRQKRAAALMMGGAFDKLRGVVGAGLASTSDPMGLSDVVLGTGGESDERTLALRDAVKNAESLADLFVGESARAATDVGYGAVGAQQALANLLLHGSTTEAKEAWRDAMRASEEAKDAGAVGGLQALDFAGEAAISPFNLLNPTKTVAAGVKLTKQGDDIVRSQIAKAGEGLSGRAQIDAERAATTAFVQSVDAAWKGEYRNLLRAPEHLELHQHLRGALHDDVADEVWEQALRTDAARGVVTTDLLVRPEALALGPDGRMVLTPDAKVDLYADLADEVLDGPAMRGARKEYARLVKEGDEAAVDTFLTEQANLGVRLMNEAARLPEAGRAAAREAVKRQLRRGEQARPTGVADRQARWVTRQATDADAQIISDLDAAGFAAQVLLAQRLPDEVLGPWDFVRTQVNTLGRPDSTPTLQRGGRAANRHPASFAAAERLRKRDATRKAMQGVVRARVLETLQRTTRSASERRAAMDVLEHGFLDLATEQELAAVSGLREIEEALAGGQLPTGGPEAQRLAAARQALADAQGEVEGANEALRAFDESVASMSAAGRPRGDVVKEARAKVRALRQSSQQVVERELIAQGEARAIAESAAETAQIAEANALLKRVEEAQAEGNPSIKVGESWLSRSDARKAAYAARNEAQGIIDARVAEYRRGARELAKQAGLRAEEAVVSGRRSADELAGADADLAALSDELGGDLRKHRDVQAALREARDSFGANQKAVEVELQGAREAYRRAESARALEGLSRTERLRVERILKNPDLHSESAMRRALRDFDEEAQGRVLEAARFLKAFFDDYYKQLRRDGYLTEHDKEAFLTRVAIGDYVPALVRESETAALKAMFGGQMPKFRDPVKFRAHAGTIKLRNESKRRAVARRLVLHRAQVGEYGDAFVGRKDAQLTQALQDAGIDVADEAGRIAKEELADWEWLETDPLLIAERYAAKTDSTLATNRYLLDMIDLFPQGRRFGQEMVAARKVPGDRARSEAELEVAARAERAGFKRVSTSNYFQAVLGSRKARKYPTELLDYARGLIADGRSTLEVAEKLAEKGVNLTRGELGALKALENQPLFLPAPVVDYINFRSSSAPKWMADIADVVGASWGGLHSLLKSFSTIAAMAHISVNVIGNLYSIGQTTLRGLANPVNHTKAMLISLVEPGSPLMKRQVKLGRYEMSIEEWQDFFNEVAITEAGASTGFLEEQVGAGAAREGGLKDTTTRVATAALGGVLGFSAGGPAGGMLGAMTGASAGGLLNRRRAVGRAVPEWDEFLARVKEDPVTALKGLQLGTRGVGTVTGAVIGSAVGAPAQGAALGAAIGGGATPGYMKMMAGVNQAAESQARATLAVALLEQGVLLDDVPMQVAWALRDYSNLNELERNVLRPLSFFYTWSAGNLRFQAKWALENPREARMVAAMFNGLYNMQFSEDELRQIPENYRHNLLLRVAGTRVMRMRGNPWDDLVELFRTDGMVPVGALTRMHPAILSGVEAWTGHSFYFDRPIEDMTNGAYYKNAPPALKKWLGVYSMPAEVFDEEGPTGEQGVKWKIDRPDRAWLLSKLPGTRLLAILQQAVAESYAPAYVETGEAGPPVSGAERLATIVGGQRISDVGLGTADAARRVERKFEELLLEELARKNPDIVRQFRQLRPEAFDEPDDPENYIEILRSVLGE